MQLVAFEPQGPRLFIPELHALEFTANRSADTGDLRLGKPRFCRIVPMIPASCGDL
jgi:hypothetical protein